MNDTEIVLQKYTQADFDTFYPLVKDDKIMRYISGKGLTLEAAKLKFESVIKTNTEQEEIGYFKIFNSQGEKIGQGKLEWYKLDDTKLEIGYMLKEEFWGQGLGTMICTKLLFIANELWPTIDIVGLIHPENIASKRLLEKFGFQSYFVGIENNVPTEKLILRKSN